MILHAPSGLWLPTKIALRALRVYPALPSLAYPLRLFIIARPSPYANRSDLKPPPRQEVQVVRIINFLLRIISKL